MAVEVAAAILVEWGFEGVEGFYAVVLSWFSSFTANTGYYLMLLNINLIILSFK